MENFNLTQFSAHAKELAKNHRFDELCAEFHRNDAIELPVPLLLLKATIIQLSDEPGFTLDDARNCLVKAADADPNYLQAWIDLGHFYLAIDDNPSGARECFAKARSLMDRIYQDLVVGEVKSLVELNRMDEAMIVLKSVPKESASEALLTLRADHLTDSAERNIG